MIATFSMRFLIAAGLTVAPLAAQLQWQAMNTGSHPAPRCGHAMTRWAIVFGGRDQTQVFADTWVYASGTAGAPGTWQQLPTATAPSGRWGFAWDTAIHDVLLFGGADLNGQPNGETWQFTTNWSTTPPGGTVVSSWQQLQPLHAPSPRRDHALAYDWATATTALLFGGRTSSGVNGETWLFTNGDWQQVATPIAPSPRAGHRLLPSAGGWLLFGGTDDTNVFDDVWQFDGQAWTSLGNAPFAATGAAAAYVGFERRRYLFVGGADALGPRDDLWERDAAGTWFAQGQIAPMSPRTDTAVADLLYHAASLHLVASAVAFGGRDALGNVLGDTWRLEPTHEVGWSQTGQGCGPGHWGQNGPELFLPSVILGNQGYISVFTHTFGALVVVGLQLDAAAAPAPCEVTVDPALLWAGISGQFSGSLDLPLAVPFFAPLRGHSLSLQALAFEPTSPSGIALSRLGIIALGD